MAYSLLTTANKDKKHCLASPVKLPTLYFVFDHDKSWSSAHILAKSILAPDDMTIPKKELAAFNAGANIKVVLERALDGWIEAIYVRW